MPKAYSDEIKTQVKALIDQGQNDTHIKEKLNISNRTLHRWRSNLRRFNQMDFPMTSTPGRPRVLGREAEEVSSQTPILVKKFCPSTRLITWSRVLYKPPTNAFPIGGIFVPLGPIFVPHGSARRVLYRDAVVPVRLLRRRRGPAHRAP